MTRDAFERAKELDYDIEVVEKLRDIIQYCCPHRPISDEHIEHNEQLERDNATLCWLLQDWDRDIQKQNYSARLDSGKTYRVVNYMQSYDIPIDLCAKLRDVIDEYIEELEKEFRNLNADYEYSESED